LKLLTALKQHKQHRAVGTSALPSYNPIPSSCCILSIRQKNGKEKKNLLLLIRSKNWSSQGGAKQSKAKQSKAGFLHFFMLMLSAAPS
jgi:hypothetical protein